MAEDPIRRSLLAAAALRRRMRGPLREAWPLELEAWQRVLHHYGKRSTWLPLAWQRQAVHVLQRPPDDPSLELEHVDAGGVPCLWIRPRGVDATRVLVYLHGGGYSIGSVASHRHYIAKIAAMSGVTGFAVDYRLAPEHPFPAQLEDSLSAWRWLLGQGFSAERILLAGESAGGGLTMSTLVALRDAGEALPRAAAVISPWVDLTLHAPAIDAHARYDYLHRDTLEAYVRRVLPHGDRRDPRISTVFADLSGLPPLSVQVGAVEALLDDARTLARRARERGVEVTLREYDDMFHAFQLFPGLPAAKHANQELVSFIRRQLGVDG